LKKELLVKMYEELPSKTDIYMVQARLQSSIKESEDRINALPLLVD